MAKARKYNVAEKFASVNQLKKDSLSDQVRALKDKMEGLQAQLQEAQNSSAIQEIPLDKIVPNPNQPRKSFYVVAEKTLTLKRDGQKAPIIVAHEPKLKKYIIFDGECRWRSAKELKWKTIKAVQIPYIAETFETDVLISAIQDNGLNSLDLAQAIMRQILLKLPQLEEQNVITKLNTALVRIRAQHKTDLIRGLEKLSPQEQEQIIAQLQLSQEEATIITEILSYQLNLFSFNSNKFPFLKLNQDIKNAIRQRGLVESQALIIDRIDPKNRQLDISDKVALKLRIKLTEQCLAEQWSKAVTQTKVKEAIALYLKDKNKSAGQTTKKYVQTINQIDVQGLSEEQIGEIIDSLEVKLAELRVIR